MLDYLNGVDTSRQSLVDVDAEHRSAMHAAIDFGHELSVLHFLHTQVRVASNWIVLFTRTMSQSIPQDNVAEAALEHATATGKPRDQNMIAIIRLFLTAEWKDMVRFTPELCSPHCVTFVGSLSPRCRRGCCGWSSW